MVRATLPAAVLAALAASNALAGGQEPGPGPSPRTAAPWVEFSSSEAHIAVKLPAKPEETSTQVGPMEMRIFTVSEGAGQPVYMIIVMGLDAVPEGQLGDPSADIAGMGPQLAEKFEGKLVRDTPAEVAGGTGRDFVIETGAGAQVAVRVVYGRKRMIQLLALGEGALAAAEANGFFPSLRLLP
jgi:hypothetical protein